MPVEAVTLLFALLAVAAELFVVATVVLVVAGRFGSAAARRWAEARELVGPQALPLAAVVAGVATAGSLYLSEVAHFSPCRLCWVQRGFMYPLALILAVAAWRGRPARGVRPVVIAMAALGGSVSVWHMLIERFPSLESSTSCDPENPCSLIWFERFGYLTIPTMALSAFAAIAVLAAVARHPRGQPEPRATVPPSEEASWPEAAPEPARSRSSRSSSG